MGSHTLADDVAEVFTSVTTTLQTVKDGLSKAWDDIKNVGQFIVDTVIRTILTSMGVSLVEAFTAIFSFFAPQHGGYLLEGR